MNWKHGMSYPESPSNRAILNSKSLGNCLKKFTYHLNLNSKTVIRTSLVAILLRHWSTKTSIQVCIWWDNLKVEKHSYIMATTSILLICELELWFHLCLVHLIFKVCILIGVKYWNCCWTLDVYLLIAIWMGQIQSKLIYIFVTYELASL